VSARPDIQASRAHNNAAEHGALPSGVFAVVLGRRTGAVVGMATALALFAIHVLAARARRDELMLGIVAGAWGTASTRASRDRVLAFDSGRVVPWLAPHGDPAWLQFATLLRFGLRWLDGRRRLRLSSPRGGPMAFLSGKQLGAVTFPAGTFSALWRWAGLGWGHPLLLAAAPLGAGTVSGLPGLPG